MTLHLVSVLDYSGMSGVGHVESLRKDLEAALAREDWVRVRRLDQTSVALINKVIAANRDDGSELILALKELKCVYARIINYCQSEVNAIVH